MSISKEGYPYIFPLAVLGVLGIVLHFWWIGGLLLALGAFVTLFFRDPERTFAGNSHQVASPADGKVLSVRNENRNPALSIFLSVFNVHINRAPIGGTITKIDYKKGKFLIAYDERASAENEQNSITIEKDGNAVRFVQIAGFIARRISCWRREGEALAVGDRIGLIKFGSRVDVFFPPGSVIHVKVGDKVAGGKTIIGE